MRKERGSPGDSVTVPQLCAWKDTTSLTVRGGSSAVVTYVCVRPLISPRAAEGDKLMAPLVDHETANCIKKRDKKGGLSRDSDR